MWFDKEQEVYKFGQRGCLHCLSTAVKASSSIQFAGSLINSQHFLHGKFLLNPISRIGALKNQKKGKQVTNESYWRTEKPEKGKRSHQ